MFDAEWSAGGSQMRESFILRKDPPASLVESERALEYAFYAAFDSDANVPGAPHAPAWKTTPRRSAVRSSSWSGLLGCD